MTWKPSNFPNGITSMGIPTFGTGGGLPPFTGNYWWVKETTTPSLSGGAGTATDPFNSLQQAVNAAANGNNDVIFLTGTAHQTAALNWNKSLLHLYGLCAPIKQGKRARISVTGATPFSNLVNVSGSGCIFSNVGTFYGFPTTGATTPICWNDTGGRNSYNDMEFLGFGDATVTTGTANQTTARAFTFNNNTGESTFTDCVFGADTLQRGAANYTLEIAGNAPRLTFQRCRFVADLAAGGTGGSHVLIGAAGIDRACVFEDCDFWVDTLSGSSTMAQIMNLSGSAGGVVMLTGKTNFFGGTHWETSASGSLYGTVPLPIAADMGKALEVLT